MLNFVRSLIARACRFETTSSSVKPPRRCTHMPSSLPRIHGATAPRCDRSTSRLPHLARARSRRDAQLRAIADRPGVPIRDRFLLGQAPRHCAPHAGFAALGSTGRQRRGVASPTPGCRSWIQPVRSRMSRPLRRPLPLTQHRPLPSRGISLIGRLRRSVLTCDADHPPDDERAVLYAALVKTRREPARTGEQRDRSRSTQIDIAASLLARPI